MKGTWEGGCSRPAGLCEPPRPWRGLKGRRGERRTSCEVGMEPAIGRDSPWGRLILLFYKVGVKMCPVRLVVHGFASEIHTNIFFFWFLSHWVGLKKYVSHGILGSGFS